MTKVLEENETLTQIVNDALPPALVLPIYMPKFSLKIMAKRLILI